MLYEDPLRIPLIGHPFLFKSFCTTEQSGRGLTASEQTTGGERSRSSAVSFRSGNGGKARVGGRLQAFGRYFWQRSTHLWLGSHVRAFRFFGGLRAIIVPNNLRSGGFKPCRYELQLNPSYAELADHYDIVVIPTRVRNRRTRPRWKLACNWCSAGSSRH